MSYDINEKQTSIDNMCDTLFERMNFHGKKHNLGNAKALRDEWVVNDSDPIDGEYSFTFIPNTTL